MRIDDLSNNQEGAGGGSLPRKVANVAYLAIRFASRSVRSDLAGRNACRGGRGRRIACKSHFRPIAGLSNIGA